LPKLRLTALAALVSLTVTACKNAESTEAGPTEPPQVTAAITNCSDITPRVDFAAAARPVCSASSLQAAMNVGGKIVLPANCNIALSAPLIFRRVVAIDGNGATISGNNVTRIFQDDRDYRQSTGSDFTLVNATLTNGRDAGSGGGAVKGAQFGKMTFINVRFANNVSDGTGGEDGGGAIYKDEGGLLRVFNSHFSGNTATNGGAIKNLLSNIQIVNSSFVGNTARGGNNGGGAIFVDGLAQTTTPPPLSTPGGLGYAPDGYAVDTYGKGRVCGTYFQGNTVGGQYDVNRTGRLGGGIMAHVYGGGAKPGATAVEIERSVFDGNTALDGGGGMRLGGDGLGSTGGTYAVSHTVVRNNRAGNHGGGIRFSESNGSFTNVTIANNCANANNDVGACTDNSSTGGLGGGIAAFEKRYSLDRVTVVRNRAASYGGALAQPGATVPGTGGPGTMINTIVASNTAGNPFGVAHNCVGPAFTNGSGSLQWPTPTIGPFELGCGSTGGNVDPNVSAVAQICPTRIAGSSTSNTPIMVFLPSTSIAAGARCPN